MVEQKQYWNSPPLCHLNMVLLMGKVIMMFMTPAPYPAANSRQSETTSLDCAPKYGKRKRNFNAVHR